MTMVMVMMMMLRLLCHCRATIIVYVTECALDDDDTFKRYFDCSAKERFNIMMYVCMRAMVVDRMDSIVHRVSERE